MRFLVIGCNGMAGHVIALYLKEQGHHVTGYARQRSELVETVTGDATDFQLLRETVWKGNYDTVINCVGLLNQSAEEDHAAAVLLNGYLPHYLVKVTAGTDTQLVHMSTDCVFSGKTGGYTEEAFPDGALFYDRSKAIGEVEDQKNLTLRNSIVGPDMKADGIGLLNWFMQKKDFVNGYTRAIWTGQTTLQLAKTMEQAAKIRAYGLYHMVPDESISKYELLKLFNLYIRRTPVEIKPMDRFVTDKSLVRTRFKGFNYKIPDYETMISELGEWMRLHRELYPHYGL